MSLERVPALTIHQPWASLIVAGGLGWEDYKDVENREWVTTYRGLLLIHASVNKQNLKYREDEEEYDQMRQGSKLPDIDSLPLGAFVGAVKLVNCYRFNPRKRRNQWEQGRFCWHLIDPVFFRKPIPAKGAQGLWTPSVDDHDLIITQLER